MALIFIASMDTMSASKTSRIIGPILRWFNPEITQETISFIQFLVRKGAHLTVYAVLAVLLLRALGRSRNVTGWSWCLARWAWVIASVYAVTDEFHQTFVDSRMGSPVDVLIDSTGAALGLWVYWWIGRWRKKW